MKRRLARHSDEPHRALTLGDVLGALVDHMDAFTRAKFRVVCRRFCAAECAHPTVLHWYYMKLGRPCGCVYDLYTRCVHQRLNGGRVRLLSPAILYERGANLRLRSDGSRWSWLMRVHDRLHLELTDDDRGYRICRPRAWGGSGRLYIGAWNEIFTDAAHRHTVQPATWRHLKFVYLSGCK